MSGRKLELLGEGVDLAIDKRAPTLDLSGRDTNALEPIDDAMGDARDGLRHERDGEDAQQDAAVSTKLKTHSRRHVAVAFGKNGIRASSRIAPQATRPNWYTIKRVNCVAPASPTFWRPWSGDRSERGGAHHHGRQVAKEDATRLDRDQVTDATGELGSSQTAIA